MVGGDRSGTDRARGARLVAVAGRARAEPVRRAPATAAGTALRRHSRPASDDRPAPLTGSPRPVCRGARTVARRRGCRDRVVAAQGLLGRAGGQAREDGPAVVADEDRAGGDVAMGPALGVEGAQGGEDVGGHLGRAVRGERALGEQGGKRAGGDQLADHPEAAGLGEDVEDLVEPGVVGDLRGGGGGRQRATHGGVARSLDRAPDGGTSGTVAVRRPVTHDVTHDLGVDDLGQRDLPDQDLLAAVGVEGSRLDQLERFGRGQRKTITVGEHPARVVVHDASPIVRSAPSCDPPALLRAAVKVGRPTALYGSLWLRTVHEDSRYVPNPPLRARTAHYVPGARARRGLSSRAERHRRRRRRSWWRRWPPSCAAWASCPCRRRCRRSGRWRAPCR